MKFIKKMLLLVIVAIMLGVTMITSAYAVLSYGSTTVATNTNDVKLCKVPQYITQGSIKGSVKCEEFVLTKDEIAMTIYYNLRNQGIAMSKNDIYEKVMNVDKTNQRVIPSDLEIKVRQNLQDILEWRKKIDKKEVAEVIYQNPEMPNGCEITSGTILLNWMGYDVDKMTMHNDYLPRYPMKNGVMPNPNEYYIGDARGRSNGWYCFEQPIVIACNQYLEDIGSNRRVKQVSGLTQEEMDKYLSWNIPLVIWMTTDYKTPRYSGYTYKLTNGESYTPYTNLHCVVVASKSDDGSYNIADPIVGWKTLSEETFWYIFTQMGSRAVTVDCDNLIL